MTNNGSDYADAISAFIDGEPVDPDHLRDALARADGRDLLVELLALRDLVTADPGAQSAATVPTVPAARAGWRRLAVAAAVGLALGGGYFAGLRSGGPPAGPAASSARIADAPPEPTVVVTVDRWTDTRKGGGS
jgi:hypothetical protein